MCHCFDADTQHSMVSELHSVEAVRMRPTSPSTMLRDRRPDRLLVRAIQALEDRESRVKEDTRFTLPALIDTDSGKVE